MPCMPSRVLPALLLAPFVAGRGVQRLADSVDRIEDLLDRLDDHEEGRRVHRDDYHLALEPQGGWVALERDDTLTAAKKMQGEVDKCSRMVPSPPACAVLMHEKYKEIADGPKEISGAALSAALKGALTEKQCQYKPAPVIWGDAQKGITRMDNGEIIYNNQVVADPSKITGDNEIELSQPVDCTVDATEEKISIPMKPLQAYDPNVANMYRSILSGPRTSADDKWETCDRDKLDIYWDEETAKDHGPKKSPAYDKSPSELTIKGAEPPFDPLQTRPRLPCANA